MPKRAGKRFERGFAQVVSDVAVHLHHVEIEASVVGDGAEELADHLGLEVAEVLSGKRSIPRLSPNALSSAMPTILDEKMVVFHAVAARSSRNARMHD